MRESTWLLEHKRNEYSQTGEDGIIEKILQVLPNNDKWCVEFGAWDGIFLSNTRHLICAKGFSAVLIEATPDRFRDLQRNYSHCREKVVTINSLVGFGDDDNLDRILDDTPVPDDFDLLSIDIDGNDYHVWKRSVRYRPKVVVIEFNPTIPTEIKFVQPANLSIRQGASLMSMVELGKEKGYELVSVLRYNAFFVSEEYFHLFHLESNAPHVLRTDLSRITYLFSGYDGKVFLHGYCRLPWHGIDLEESAIQPLPSYLQRHPESFRTGQKIAFYLFLLFNDPERFLKMLRKRAIAGRKGWASADEN
jgi:hypothetical protein